MRASLQTMKWYGAEGVANADLAELTKLATNRLGGLEGVEQYGKRFDGIVVAKIVSCKKHEGADKLNVCMIDDGRVVTDIERDKDGYVQVVCGAPNAREGLTVAWLPPGSTVPKTFGEAEPFVLGKREIRGVISNGMLASPSELGLYENHDGILEVDETEVGAELMAPGTEFKKLYGLDDKLLDFENKMFTHRPDCFGQIGLARELSAIQGVAYTSPEWYFKKPQFDTVSAQKIHVFNDIPATVPRLMVVAMSGVVVSESPVWLKSFITRMGGKPVNNVVDISNYVMHITGQPTHAYDLNKLDGTTLGARMAKDGETINLLNGKTAQLIADDMVIADAKGPVGIAGIMGGNDTEVDQSTTDILLEVATFDMYTIRRTAMRHGLFTDAFTRFSKGQSPLQNDRVIKKFMEMLSEITGAEQSSEVYDLTSDNTETMLDQHAVHEPVKITPDFINSRLGTTLSFDDIREILKNVEMAVIPGDGDEFEVGAPFWRTDIELPEDIVEEVGRLYGFDRLALKLPQRSTKPAPQNQLNELKDIIRQTLSASGANEALGYSFVHGKLLKDTGIADVEQWAFHIRNAISPDLQYYRTSIIPGLLTKVHPNIKSDLVRSDDNEFALFEIGKAHVKNHNDDEGLPTEFERLGFVIAADEKTATRKYTGAAYYQAKKYMQEILRGQGEFRPLETNDYPICAMYQIGRSAMVYIDGELLGVVGEFRTSVKKALKLPTFCAGFELDIEMLYKKLRQNSYQPISTFPKTQQDITFVVDNSVTYKQLYDCIRDSLLKACEQHGYEYALGPRDIFKKNEATTKNMTFRIWLHHPAKTLKTEEANRLLDTIATEAKNNLGAKRV